MVNSIFGRYILSSLSTAKSYIIDSEDQLRADMYSFLASLLRKEPSAELIKQIHQFQRYKNVVYSTVTPL